MLLLHAFFFQIYIYIIKIVKKNKLKVNEGNRKMNLNDKKMKLNFFKRLKKGKNLARLNGYKSNKKNISTTYNNEEKTQNN